MDYQKTDYGYQLRLETGEEIHSSISKFMKDKDLKSGVVVGIGAMSSYALGYFDMEIKDYRRTDFVDDVELLSCIGNISYKGETPVAHLHAIVSNSRMETTGGHLFEGIISATGEFSIFDGKVDMKRLNVDTGLPLFDLTEHSS